MLIFSAHKRRLKYTLICSIQGQGYAYKEKICTYANLIGEIDIFIIYMYLAFTSI